MAQNKTQATTLSVDAHLATLGDAGRRLDGERLVALMAGATGQPAVMWGSAIIGFGVHRYALASGKPGEICAVGFALRKGDIAVYGAVEAAAGTALPPSLGKHKLGKGCLYIGRLADVDLGVLAQLVGEAFKARHAV